MEGQGGGHTMGNGEGDSEGRQQWKVNGVAHLETTIKATNQEQNSNDVQPSLGMPRVKMARLVSPHTSD